MRRANTYRIFMKYLFSYVIILLLPISLMTLVVYNVFVDKLLDETISGNLNTLDKVRYVLDEQLKRVEDTTFQLMLEDNRLSQFRVSDDRGYKAWGITSELKRYQKMNPFIDEIWLYYRGEDTVYTSRSVYALSDLTTQIYQFADWTQAQVIEDLNALSVRTIRPPSMDSKGQERLMRIIVPVLPYQHKSYATVVYLIKEKAFQTLLANHTSTGGSTWVMDQNNQIVTGLGETRELRADTILQLVNEDMTQSYRKVTVGTADHYLFAIKSKQTGWTYATLLPVRLVLDKLERAKQMFIYGVTIVLLFGAVFIFYSMRWNYRPIHQLKLDTEQMFRSNEPSLNELETVRYALNSLASQKRKLDERVKNHAFVARKQLLLSLIKGDFSSAEELRLYGDEIDFPIRGSLFRVAIMEYPATLDLQRHLPLAEMEKLLPSELTGYGLEHLEKNRYIFLTITDGIELTTYTHLLSSFREAIRGRLNESVTIGVGNVSELHEIPRSYLEAYTAIGYRFIQGYDRTIYFEDIPVNQPAQEEYPHQEMEGLRQSIRTGNATKVESSLSNMLSYIRQNQLPLVVARGLVFDIIRTVNRTWTDMGINDQSLSNYPDVFSLERLDTIDDFEQLIKSMCLDLCAAFQSVQNETNGLRSAEHMVEYIQQHYHLCDFSFQNMARHFGMALPNLSQFFKDQYGQTLLDYTTNLRMERAKGLLVAQDVPLKVIAEEVGYYNVSSFIRRFKQLEGVTPGEYRIQLKAETN
ncbi:AraC-type DNA-binding protein [Paenibacillus sp. 1_12]|uniref:helix-turn-helix domain-containing protein n=1 Tax=Paenibacillus sp. 1_12 TaxID=1566278 RepID=UPI0008E1F4B7|nr:helix-turn-helix domain-containing protein [Paenibacillus sp. 1_12]SFM54506.1 AraC-type DNA-binding protein [Paenibacillus sp. 1_12]